MTKKAPTKITISKKALANAEIARLEEELRRTNNELVLSKRAHLSELNRAKAFQKHLKASREITNDLAAKSAAQSTTISEMAQRNKVLAQSLGTAQRAAEDEKRKHGLTDIELKLKKQEILKLEEALAANPFKSLWRFITTGK